MATPIDYLIFQAKMQPKGVAIQRLGGAVTFSQLWVMVRRVAAKLRASGVRPGSVVATFLPDSQLDWVVTLALFHEAAVSCAVLGEGAIDSALGVDFLITVRPLAGVAGGNTILIDPQWEKAAMSETTEIKPFAYQNGASVCRLVLTSGTTGVGRAVPLNIDTLNARVSTLSNYWSWSSHEMNLMGLSSVGGFFTAVNCLVVGMPFFVPYSLPQAIELIYQFRITSLLGSPTQLGALVGGVESSSLTLDSLRIVRSAGGPLPSALLAKIKTTLCSHVLNIYGSTEAGGICAEPAVSAESGAIAAGYAVPGVQIEIVDQHHQPVAQGQTGMIRVKTHAMAHAYFRNPEATAQSYRDGWFYSGDTGRLRRDGYLFLGGRESELINLGGVKMDPVTMDQFVLTQSGVKDAAVFGVIGQNGLQKVGLALVASEQLDLSVLKAALLSEFGRAKVPTIFMRLEAIPRNQMGKVMRAALTSKASESGLANAGQKA